MFIIVRIFMKHEILNVSEIEKITKDKINVKMKFG